MAIAGRSSTPALQISGLNVYYGASHALQGVDLELQSGVLSVVGRNGMGKTTLCQAIMGLVPVSAGSIRFAGQELSGMSPAAIARLGVGYVPQGRRLWRTLTVDEHLRMMHGKGAWTRERIYATFPRLAERKSNGGGQLSGGEQQMLAIARALLLNPSLLVMDEPTEGLAPVIVSQVEDMLLTLGAEGDVDVLVIEQNIGVATSVSDEVAIMVNGQVNRRVPAAQLAADRALQQQLLGVGRVDDTGAVSVEVDDVPGIAATGSPVRFVYQSNPTVPNRWSKPVPARVVEQTARTVSSSTSTFDAMAVAQPLNAQVSSAQPAVLVAGTLDTKGVELRFIRDCLLRHQLPVKLVDLSTSGEHEGADVPAHQIAAFHPRGSSGVFTGDRGTSVTGMTLAFERWISHQSNVLGIIGAGGSGGTSLVAPAMRSLPFGIPKLIISTVASGEVSQYMGPADIMMMYSVADVSGLNSITRDVLQNGAEALAGMVSARRRNSAAGSNANSVSKDLHAVGLTMFGVTTACVQQLVAELESNHDCLVFHATGIGGQSMEKLIDNGRIEAVLDITTTEVCDMIAGGVFPATEDRFGAIIRRRIPYIGSCGALDMVNFGEPDSVPSHYADRLFYEHNAQVTLMRTTVEENVAIGEWIGHRLNQMEGPVRFFLPHGGVSALDAPGAAFDDKGARDALFGALKKTVRQTQERQLIDSVHHINSAGFAEEVLRSFHQLHGVPTRSHNKKSTRG